MSLVESVKHVFSNYATFAGRASRSEYWWFALAWFIAYFVIVFLALATGKDGQFGAIGALLILVFVFGTFIPMISVMVRRLHDIGKSGWWYWISLIPLIGGIWLLVLMVTGSDGPNEYGEGPA